MAECLRRSFELRGDCVQLRGMAFHRPTGTLLIASPDYGNAMAGVELLDTRPPPAQWALREADRLPAVRQADGKALLPVSIAIDDPNGFVYVATSQPQTVTQFKATVRTRTADDEALASPDGDSTVDLMLTAVRMIDGVQCLAWGCQLTAIAVLSPSTLLLSHKRTVGVLHPAFVAGVGGVSDSKLTGPLGELRPLTGTGHYSAGIVVDAERRRIFSAEMSGMEIAMYDADSGRRIAAYPIAECFYSGGRDGGDIALIDGMLVIAANETDRLRFLAIDAIPWR
jgi:hypothetical protein